MSSVVEMVNDAIAEGIRLNASDIHFEPTESGLHIRYRVDGMLRSGKEFEQETGRAIISRLKVMSDMDIGIHRTSQNGRFSFGKGYECFDVRASTLPSIYGEKVVLRLLRENAEYVHSLSLGMTGVQYTRYSKLLKLASGVILISGPTGSGKSTTLYAMLKDLNTPEVNIISLEDPVEYKIPDICQVQINENGGMSFSSGVRAALRQDPDIIAIGEIRDRDTAENALRAAITGRLVISTIHTEKGIEVVERLKDLGIEDYLAAAALKGVIAERLVRKTCERCGGVGCPECGNTGYSGRTGVFEIMQFTPDIIRMKDSGASNEEVIDYIRRTQPGYSSLPENAAALVRKGITTKEEISRVLGEDVVL